MTIPDPLAALCALLDRSIVQIAEASADARVFDRATIIGVSDVWDNNTFPLFRAAVGEPRRGRKKRALDALLWMSEFRREWMVEQAAIAGFALAEDLPPNPPQVPYRDFAGYVHPMHRRLESGAIAEIAADYHLEAEAAAPDLHGLAMTPTAEGIKIAIGESGFVHVADGHLSIADVTWHLSKAGRRADAEIRAAAPAEGPAELRMIKYTPEELLRHYAVPAGSEPGTRTPCRIAVLQDPEPSAFTRKTEDFEA